MCAFTLSYADICLTESVISLQWRFFLGAIAQLGERLHGMQEVAGSIPASSTKF